MMSIEEANGKGFRVLVTGDRNFTNGELIYSIFRQIPDYSGYPPYLITLIHGSARGADTIAAFIAAQMEWRAEPFKANWKLYGKAAGPIRNQEMLASGVDICLAFHDNISESKGTKDMINRCRQANIPTALYGNGELIQTWNWG